MKEIMKYSALSRILNQNYYIKKALQANNNHDRTIRMVSKEVTDLILNLLAKKRDFSNKGD